jgi:flagellar basal body-associated protein FliL
MKRSTRDPKWRQAAALFMALLMLNATVAPAMATGAMALRDNPEGVKSDRADPQQQQQQQVEPLLIGVLDLETNDVTAPEARAIADRLRIYLGRQAIFEVIERNQMEGILDELGFQLSGACDTDECVVQVGKILGARKMIAGSVSKVGTIYALQIRIVDIESARIEHSTFSDVDGIEQVLQEATVEVAQELATFVLAQMTPEAPEPQPVQQEEVTPPPQEEVQQPVQQPAEEEQQTTEPRKKSKTWLYLLLVAVVGGGGAMALGGGGGDTGGGPDPISGPPSRPPIPPA